MKGLFEFIFNNAILAIIIGILYYIYRQYKSLKERDSEIKLEFNKVLNVYLDKKIKEAKDIITDIEKNMAM